MACSCHDRCERNIEVDEATASTLASRAAVRGLSVSELIAEMTAAHDTAAVSHNEIAELERQWNAIKSGERTIEHEKVVRWLQTWGTPSFRPWNDR
jgi:ribosomal protein L12E/L44/L45/RPP1/RPP2